MSRFFLPWLLGCCAPYHTGGGGTANVPVETLPGRVLTVAEASTELWRPELRPPWRAPTDAETAAVQALVPDLLHAAQTHAISGDAAGRAAAVGMRLERWTVGGGEHLVLSELPDQRRGAGAYLFSVAHPVSGSPWVLWEAPHPYFDQRTGDIAAALYFSPPPGPAPAAFFTSSLHRYTQADGKRDKRSTNPADPCHNAAHLFNVATQAAAGTFTGITVIQLHGFSFSDDENRPPDGTIAVVSAGRKDGPTSLSSAAAGRLSQVLGEGVRLYPTEAQVLGATTNVEKAGLEAVPGSRFLHVEMSAPLRDLLFQDPSRRDALGAALLTLAADPALAP